jgi:hypothetical protein
LPAPGRSAGLWSVTGGSGGKTAATPAESLEHPFVPVLHAGWRAVT